MNAGRGGLRLVTTDPMDNDPDQQEQGPITDPDAISAATAGTIDNPGLAAARAALAASNRLGVLRPASERSTLYASITKSIFTALEQDKSFECLIERPHTGLELVHILIAIRYYELTGELSKTEARELRNGCESKMSEAATAKKRKYKVTPKDMYAARKAAETFTLTEAQAEDASLDKAIAKYESKAKKRQGRTMDSFALTEEIFAKYGYKPLEDAIIEAKNTGNFTIETATDAGPKECSILEAIFWARKLGKINDGKTFNLLKRCLGSMSEAGVECSAMDLITISSAGLFKNIGEARGVFRIIRLSPIETQLFKEELDTVLGRQTAPTQSAGPAQSTPTAVTQPAIAAQTQPVAKPEIDWTPAPSRRGWFPETFVIEKNEKKPLIPTGTIALLQSRETRRSALEVVALAAILAIGGKVMNMVNQEESPRIRWEIPESATATKAPENSTEPFPLGSITITVGPDIAAKTDQVATDAATTAPEAIITPPISVASAAPQEQPSTTTPSSEAPPIQSAPQPQPAPQVQPTPPETVAQNTIALPISTKPGAYGGVALDEPTSKKLWESAGYAVKARMGAGGKKIFVLSKDGKSFVISDTKLTAGQAEIIAAIE